MNSILSVDAIDCKPKIIIYVDDDALAGGNGSITHPFKTINEAIDFAQDGDTIFVFNGTYDDIIILEKSIDLIGEDKNSTFLIYPVEFRHINRICIKRFNFINQGLNVYGSSCLIIAENVFQGFHNLNIVNSSNCTISDNYVYKSSRPIIIRADAHNNIIKNNHIDLTDDDGISISTGSKGNIVSNNLIANCEGTGIFVSSMRSNYTIISGNIIRNCGDWGIVVEGSYCTISDNIVEFCGCDGITINWGDENNILNNYIDGNYGDSYGISLLWSCANIVIENVVTKNLAGVYIAHDGNNHVANNSIIGNGAGVAGFYSHENLIVDNEINNNNIGTYFYESNLNDIKRNTISNNANQGVFFEGLLFGNVVAKNDIFNNNIGVDLEGFKNINQQPKRRIPAENYIVGNNIKNNYAYGIRLNYLTLDNHFYYNNLINNNINAYDTGTNTWFKVLGSEGNYWSDWGQNPGYPNNYNVPPLIIRNIDLYPSSEPYDTEVIVGIDEESMATGSQNNR